MKTILVPTDYSPTSKNAAVYAFQLAAELKAERIILYNAYQAPPILTEATIPIMPIMDIETLEDISKKGMIHFKEGLTAVMNDAIKVEERTVFGTVVDGIEEICEETAIDMVVMGISGTSKLEEMIIGSTATSVLRHVITPVIVVPSEASFKPLKNVMFACDYKNVVKSVPLEKIKGLLDSTGASLHVLNIYHEKGSFDADLLYEEELAHSILRQFSPQFHAVENESFIDGINQFVEEHQIDLIISIPKKHGFFDGLFKESHTKQMAFHSHVPLLAIHEEEL